MCINKGILATLAYFDMFDYPLKKRELLIFLQQAVDNPDFENALDCLLKKSVVFKLNDFFSLSNNFLLVERRLKGNIRADELLKKADRGAKFLSKFPFVRGVAVSGSLSKNFADESADVDFFIIAAANRLWIARSFLHLFKKFTFLLNKQHMYCMNYFIDEEEPTIVEKNIYTATEIATLLPLYGSDTFKRFYAANGWTKEFLPNHTMRSPPAKSWAAKSRKKKKNIRGIIMSLDTSRHFAKPSAVNFQQKLLKRYENKVAELFDNYEKNFPVKAGL